MRLAPEITSQARPSFFPDEDSPTSQLFLHGKSMGGPVRGCFLESAVAWRNQYLVFLTDGYLFEEALNIHLFDTQLRLLDSAMMLWPDCAGSFSQLRFDEPDALIFNFWGEAKDWRIRLHDGIRFHTPLFSDPWGVWRRVKWSRHFTVEQLWN